MRSDASFGSESHTPLDFSQQTPLHSSQAESTFDVPLKKKVLDYGPSPYYPNGRYRKELSCYFYPKFTVKQYDEGEKGAEWLAIVPVVGRAEPQCALHHGSGEKIIRYPEWSGYFNGVKGDLVFFDAPDGWDEGMPFVIYDSRTVTKVFEDSYHDTSFLTTKSENSPFNHMLVMEAANGQVSLKYLRVAEAGCDLHKEGPSCWESVRKKLGIEIAEAPVCTRYEGITERWESAVAYAVEVTLFPTPVVKPTMGPVRCWPVD